jgi:hypothetical protein
MCLQEDFLCTIVLLEILVLSENVLEHLSRNLCVAGRSVLCLVTFCDAVSTSYVLFQSNHKVMAHARQMAGREIYQFHRSSPCFNILY